MSEVTATVELGATDTIPHPEYAEGRVCGPVKIEWIRHDEANSEVRYTGTDKKVGWYEEITIPEGGRLEAKDKSGWLVGPATVINIYHPGGRIQQIYNSL